MNTKGLFIVPLVAASAAIYAHALKGPVGPWTMSSIRADGYVYKIGHYQTHAECQKAISQVELEQHTTNGQCILAPLGAFGGVPDPWDMTVTMPNGNLRMIVDYPSKATCEQDIPDVEASQGARDGHCDPGVPDTTSLDDLEAEACPSPTPTTEQDWQKRNAVLLQVCAGVELECSKGQERNVLCYESHWRLLPTACRAALIELGCTTQGEVLAAKQRAEERDKNLAFSDNPDCTPDQITISNRILRGNVETWNATCNGKNVYLCSGQFRWPYSCALVVTK